jgi:acetyltransferase-like isoleucine patch superfamily enzyme
MTAVHDPFLRRLGRRLKRLTGQRIPQETLARLYPQQQIGRGSYGGLKLASYPNDADLVMGNYCSVATDATVLLGGEHRLDWVTTFPMSELDPAANIQGHPHTRGRVTIGSDVWIGREAMILSGVTIGHGAVIGARALIRSDVPPYAIYAGNPAKLVRLRFPDDIVQRLLEIAWWDWPEERIARAATYLSSPNIKAFIDAVDRGVI